MKIVPIYLLSGFLGSGKTTLLSQMVEQAQAAGLTPAVLMNELGEVNLDGQLVSKEVAMAEVLGGCICCSMRGDLSLELNQLLQQYKPDLVIVESTGAAHPLESIDAISETSMYKHAKLQEVVTVVDSEHMLARSKSAKDKTYRLMQEQIRCATLILLNKCDRLHPEQVVELQQLVRELNGYAPIITTTHAQLKDWTWLLQPSSANQTETAHEQTVQAHGHSEAAKQAQAHEHSEPAKQAQAAQQRHGQTHEHTDEHSHEHTHEHTDEPGHGHAHEHTHEHTDGEHEHTHAPHYHHSHVMAHTHYWKQPPHSEQFEAWLAQLPANIYRAKGIMTFRDLPSRFLFQFAYRESDFMRIEPQGTVHDVAVFIGEHFDAEWLKQELEKLEQQAEPEGEE